MTSPPAIAQTEAIVPPPTAISATDALGELNSLTERNRIVEVLLGYASGIFPVAVLFAVRDQLAFGWKAVGEFPGRASVEHLLIPLDAPSIIQAATAAENGVFHGAPIPSTVNSYLYKVLGCAEPRAATAGVITIGKRIVNVLYGQGAELTPLQQDDLQSVCDAAAEAYARLIAASKAKR
jgi:hypothetical protein